MTPHATLRSSRAAMTAALLLAGFCLSPTARAQDAAVDEPPPDRSSLTVGPGAIYTPDFEGSGDHDIQPFPFIAGRYRDLLFIEGNELGANLLRLAPSPSSAVKAGPIARYRRDRPEKRNPALRGLGDVGIAIEVGGFLRLDSGPWSLQVAGGKDVAGGHDGILADARLSYQKPLTQRLIMNVSGTVSWTDDRFMRSYFGVTPEQSAASGLPVYRAHKGVKDVGGTAALTYMLNRRWALSGFAGYARLLNDAAGNPLVRQRGKRDQISGGLFVGYRF